VPDGCTIVAFSIHHSYAQDHSLLPALLLNCGAYSTLVRCNNMRRNLQQRVAWITALILCITVVSSAGDKNDRERVYNAPFDKVWNAACRLNEKYTITHSEKASGVLSFKQGMSWKTNSYGMDVGVTVVAVRDIQTKVILNAQKQKSQLSWAGGDITQKFFEAVDKNLKESMSSPSPGK
jgi:hypothetical protein